MIISSFMGSLEAACRTSQEASHKEVVKSTDASQTSRFKSWLRYLLGQCLGTCYFTSLCLSVHNYQMDNKSTMLIGPLGGYASCYL